MQLISHLYTTTKPLRVQEGGHLDLRKVHRRRGDDHKARRPRLCGAYTPQKLRGEISRGDDGCRNVNLVYKASTKMPQPHQCSMQRKI